MIRSISAFVVLILFSTFGYSNNLDVPVFKLTAPNLEAIKKSDLQRDRDGFLYRVGVAEKVTLSSDNSGVWSTLANRNRKWELIIDYKGAESISFIFSQFKLSKNASFWVEDLNGKKVSVIFTDNDHLEDFQQNIAFCKGDYLKLNLVEEVYSNPSEIVLDRVFYNYRSTVKSSEKINESASCQVNVNCSEGDNYQDEKKGVARVYVIEGNSGGFCSGSLVNNQAKNCKPLFLTALHCGESTSNSDMKLWQFHFNYEAVNCSNPSTVGTLENNYVTGCVRLADAADGGGNTGSDFMLVQLGTLQNETSTINKLKGANFQAYWNGWDANNSVSSNGTGIHHPSGDIKKISTYTTSVYSDSYGGNVSNTHWTLSWAATQNGHGVTEGGSSGSPLFKYNNGNSRIIGTLTGGASYCSAPNDVDTYGKMSYHWASNGSTTNKKVSTYLDPQSTGLKTLDGSSNPCSLASIEQIQITNQFTVYPNPSNDVIYIKSNSADEVHITIYDVLGSEVKSCLYSDFNLIEISLSDLEKGVYQLKIEQGNSTVIRGISKF